MLDEFFTVCIIKPFRWFFSMQPLEAQEKEPAKKLLKSIRVTSKCRFNAADRLKGVSSYSFLTTTFLSLGLIFIPLYQSSGLPLPYSNSVLSIIQIFLAVAVLVYSVVNGTAKYELRAESLDECGIQLKELIRKLRRDINELEMGGISVDLEKYHADYHVISTEPENHRRADYLFTILESRSDFDLTGIIRVFTLGKAYLLYSLPYIIPTLMILFEIAFIADILGVTEIFTSVLSQEANKVIENVTPKQ
ncbi:SLATT domain-containing protein [Aliivibrio wodanis]|uniref:SLATT domain-containing protein n=1 Tax=Aliivibrio wodanis TaxID=80852 RepID=UPI00406C6596